MTSHAFITLPMLLLAGASYGQTAPVAATSTGPTSASVTSLTREMGNRLQLNEGQYIKLYSINRTRLSRQQEIEHSTTSDVAARTAQLAELQSQYEQECARILTPSQLSQLQQQDQTASSVGNGQG